MSPGAEESAWDGLGKIAKFLCFLERLGKGAENSSCNRSPREITGLDSLLN